MPRHANSRRGTARFPVGGSLHEGCAVLNRSAKAAARPHAAPPMPLKKQLGQHLLKNQGIVTKIFEAAQISPADVVLEIGPGTGNLTMRLCAAAAKVRAVEIDKRMALEVQRRAFREGYSNLEVVTADALKADFGQFHVCAANLPYQISSPFLAKLFALQVRFRCAVLMFQKEFGERLLAQPGEPHYCRLSVNAQFFCKVGRICNVARGSFNPPPKVDSVVVKLQPLGAQREVDFAQWDAMLRVLFSRKHRTLRAALTTSSVASALFALFELRAPPAARARAGDLAAFKQYLSDALEQLTYLSSEQLASDLDAAPDAASPVSFAGKRPAELGLRDFLALLQHLARWHVGFPPAAGAMARAFEARSAEATAP